MQTNFASGLTPIRVVSSFRLRKSPVNVVFHRNQRENWAIALKTSGKTYYEQDGNRFLSDSFHVILLPKGGNYTWSCVEQGECILINFDAPEQGDTLRSVSISDNSYICSSFSKIQKCMYPDTPTNRLEAMYHLYGVLLHLEKNANKTSAPLDKYHILDPAIDYIAEHYSDPGINNDFLADLCGISTVHFRKTFLKAHGASPIRFLNNLRIDKAKTMLRSDYGSVGQVAESVGYNSIFRFSKMFHQRTGQSPLEFAKNTFSSEKSRN